MKSLDEKITILTAPRHAEYLVQSPTWELIRAYLFTLSFVLPLQMFAIRSSARVSALAARSSSSLVLLVLSLYKKILSKLAV